MIFPSRITRGDTIGLFSPCHVADPKHYDDIARCIERLGFSVRLADNIFSDAYGYAGSAEERADDLNSLILDDEVKMILFSGGSSAVEILPYIDYEAIKNHPKIISSYSDGTSILNAIHAKTGLVTYYGPSAGSFADLRYYNYMQFRAHFVEGCGTSVFFSNSTPRTIHGGACRGTLIGGYAMLFALMLSNRYFNYDKNRDYILFLEDSERYSDVGEASEYLAFIAESEFMERVTGLIYGHYSDNVPDPLIHTLERFGERNDIPVIYTDDFGHGSNQAVFPIGVDAELDADDCALMFDEF